MRIGQRAGMQLNWEAASKDIFLEPARSLGSDCSSSTVADTNAQSRTPRWAHATSHPQNGGFRRSGYCGPECRRRWLAALDHLPCLSLKLWLPVAGMQYTPPATAQAADALRGIGARCKTHGAGSRGWITGCLPAGNRHSPSCHAEMRPLLTALAGNVLEPARQVLSTASHACADVYTPVYNVPGSIGDPVASEAAARGQPARPPCRRVTSRKTGPAIQ